jgi:hypothetical protein
MADGELLVQILDDEKERDKQQIADETSKADDDLINLIPTICLRSPWRLLQFGIKPEITSATSVHSSPSLVPSAAKSPVMNRKKRRKFRGVVKNICQLSGEKKSHFLEIAHIVPKHTAEESFAEWKINCKTNSDKTYLLVLSALEASFDRGDFCLLMKILPGTIECIYPR